MDKLSHIIEIQSKDIDAKVKIDPFNERIWVLDFKGDASILMEKLKPYQKEYSIGKILCTVRENEKVQFENIGFKKEADIEGFFNGENVYFLANYPDKNRENFDYIKKENEVLHIATSFYKDTSSFDGEDTSYIINTATEKDVEEMAHLYTTIFKTYPTPLEDINYIKKMMKENVLFKIIRYKGRLISAASADMDPKYLNAEITDCATYPEYRGKGLMSKLIDSLEKELINHNYKTIYTIARAGIIGINRAFAKRGYVYKGRLINNCHIGGRFEDMNIWVKQ